MGKGWPKMLTFEEAENYFYHASIGMVAKTITKHNQMEFNMCLVDALWTIYNIQRDKGESWDYMRIGGPIGGMRL